jgi:CheY-like chemotaxis protein
MIHYKHLLLIDDDKDDHEFFKEAVTEIDGSIVCECLLSGEDALDELRSGKRSLPDLIILDTNMPKMDGKQILRELKADSSLMHIPVVMYSTFLSERDNLEFLQLGAALTLSKPSKVIDFTNSLSDVLTNKWHGAMPKAQEEK